MDRIWQSVGAVLMLIATLAGHWVLCRIVWEVRLHSMQHYGASFGDFYQHYYRHTYAHRLTLWGALSNWLLFVAALPIGLWISRALLWPIPSARRAQFSDRLGGENQDFLSANRKFVIRSSIFFGVPVLVVLWAATNFLFVNGTS